MQKEEGYDEFLAEKIKKSEEEFARGEFLTLEESKARSEALLVKLEQEMQEFELGYQYA